MTRSREQCCTIIRDCRVCGEAKGKIQFLLHIGVITYNYSFRIASADFTGFLRIWRIQDILREVENHLLKALRKEKKRIDPVDFVEHRSTYSHRHHITMIHLDAFRVITCSRDQSVLIQDFWQQIIKEKQD